jgi:hypothetical protein
MSVATPPRDTSTDRARRPGRRDEVILDKGLSSTRSYGCRRSESSGTIRIAQVGPRKRRQVRRSRASPRGSRKQSGATDDDSLKALPHQPTVLGLPVDRGPDLGPERPSDNGCHRDLTHHWEGPTSARSPIDRLSGAFTRESVPVSSRTRSWWTWCRDRLVHHVRQRNRRGHGSVARSTVG